MLPLTLPLLDRQEQSASIKGQRQWIVSSDAEPWSDARKGHAVKRNLRKNALKRHYADL